MKDFREHLAPAPRPPVSDFSARRKYLLGFMLLCMLALVVRATVLQVFNKDFLQEQADMQQISEVNVSAYRGMITDRNGAPLAVSTPVESVWVNPRQLQYAPKDQLKIMEQLLALPKGQLNQLLQESGHKKFAYLARRISPELAQRIKDLKLAGVYFDREFKRFYPTSGISAHLVGFTNVDEQGQEGIEKRYEEQLKGVEGSKLVVRDGKRRIIEDVDSIREPQSGKTIALSIDQRIQYLAYRELANAVAEHKAKAGTLVIIDAKNGEVLAAVNQPSFNPNARNTLKEELYRNRAITDIFEPGSTVKPFTVAAALDGGYIHKHDTFATHGIYNIGKNKVTDVHHYGTLDVTGVIRKSSNIGVTLMSLKMPPKYFWGIYHQLGFGVSAQAGFPGESSGRLLDYHRWHDFDRAVVSFGYGLNVSALQLARAYTALADDGILHSVSLLKREEDPAPQRVFSEKTARDVREMMETVITKEGTAYEARVDGYRVGGKTGTVKKAAGSHGYTTGRYFAVFAGLAPANDPRLICVVMIDEPSAGDYYGGLVAAPVFSKVMAGALRILDVAPDQENTMPVLLTPSGVKINAPSDKK
ncbi:MAG: penicillin-binding transpeptidase domain-containing protein [Methylococcaceae bacterium]